MDPKLSIIISVYNEEQNIELLWAKLAPALEALAVPVECIFVDDGSKDSSSDVIISVIERTPHISIRLIRFTRNYGHESAMKAGLRMASGEVLICMDADLQHPVEEIEKIWNALRSGADAVFMIREQREDGGALRSAATKLYYRILGAVSGTTIRENATDFFGVSKQLYREVDEQYHDRITSVRSVFQLNSRNSVYISFAAPKRAHGESKYSFMRLLSMSISVLTQYTHAPLRLAVWLSAAYALIGGGLASYSVVKYATGAQPAGYTTLVVFMSLSFGGMFLVVGIVGYYLSIILRGINRDPEYVIKEIRQRSQQ